MTIYAYLWLCTTMYDHVQPNMNMHGYVCLWMPSYAYVCLYMTIYDHIWLSIALYDYIWLCMTIYDLVRPNMTMNYYVYIYGTLQYQATFSIDIFLFSGSVWWLSVFMEMEFLQNSKSLFSFIQCPLQKIQVSAFRRNLGCVPYAQNWVFFQKFQNTAFLLLYYSAYKKATAMCFILGDRGYSAVRFEYKTASERYSVAEI